MRVSSTTKATIETPKGRLTPTSCCAYECGRDGLSPESAAKESSQRRPKQEASQPLKESLQLAAAQAINTVSMKMDDSAA
jgi:hypothetical protein